VIRVIDYGLGNVKAFLNAFNVLGIDADRARTNSDLDDADHLILPGVGSFDLAIDLFSQSGMRDKVETMVFNHNVPILGVCVGMQILADFSEEGALPGLGWIKGKVNKINPHDQNNMPLVLPHMGWNTVKPCFASKLFPITDSYEEFYFLHSFHFVPEELVTTVAEFDYGGTKTCVVSKENIFGVQCHPEKSHHHGLRLLSAFAKS
jgi:imidazole glycerol-phosphate synthase subunit HisH